MSRRPTPVFLERRGYRRRRLADAARLLPLFGVTLLAIPLLWPSPGPEAVAAGQTQAVSMSVAFLYVFGIWALLIVLTALFGLRSRGWSGDESPHGPPGAD